MMKSLYFLYVNGNHTKTLSLLEYGNTKCYVTHTFGSCGSYFDNINAALRDLENTYCYNFFTGKKLSKKECAIIKSKQEIVKVGEK